MKDLPSEIAEFKGPGVQELFRKGVPKIVQNRTPKKTRIIHFLGNGFGSLWGLLGDFWGCLGHLVAAWPRLGQRVEKKAQEQPKRVQKRPQDPRERPKRLPREVPKTPKEFEGVPESTQDKLRKHRESKSTRKQPNTAPPKNL